MSRVKPKGQPFDCLEQGARVPVPWRANLLIPEKLGDFGTPWFVGQCYGNLRKGMLRWPMHGLGQFVVGVHGAVILCCWPGQSVLANGVRVGQHG